MRNIVNAYGINIPLYLDDLVAWLSYEKETKKTNGEYINTATTDREIVREREGERKRKVEEVTEHFRLPLHVQRLVRCRYVRCFRR